MAGPKTHSEAVFLLPMARFICTVLLLTCVACEAPIPAPVKPPDPPTEPPSDEELLAARPYSVRTPPGYDADAGTTWPLVVALHGYGGSAMETVNYYSLDRLAESRGFFLFAPNGLPDSRGNRAWNPGRSRWPEWDQSWLTAALRDIKRKYQVDASRVIVFGASQGAHMAHRMGCDGSEDVTAVISVAGQLTTDPQLCAPTRPVTALQIHGTADEAIGYYGDLQNVPPKPDIPSAHDTIGVWARNDGCTGMLEVSAISPINISEFVDGPETIVETYAGCPNGVAVGLWSMQGVQHRPLPTPDFSSRAIGFGLARPRQ